MSTPGKGKLSTAQWVAINGAVATAALTIFVVGVAVASLGQAFGLLPSGPPSPDLADPAISARRDDALLGMRQDFDRISATAQLRYGGGGTEAYCDSGQHNYKVTDDYYYRCEASLGEFYGYTGDFDDAVGRLDATMTELGWTGKDAKDAVERYRKDLTRFTEGGLAQAKAERAAVDAAEPLFYQRGATWVTVEFAASDTQAATHSWMYVDNPVDSAAAKTEFLNAGAMVFFTGDQEFFRN